MPHLNENFITITNLSLQFADKSVLNAIDLIVKRGDFITIMGPNGAGKSMLIKVILGIVQPSHGTIHKADGLKIGYMPQHCHLEPSMPLKVKEFITLNKPKNTYQDISNLCEIGHLMDNFIYNLSGGELQRVLCARALMGSPDLLIMDEPSQNLDLKNMDKFYQLIEKIYAQKNITIIMVSHDLHFVLASSTEVICLYKHICCRGPAHSISNQAEFKEIFGADLIKKFSYYHHHHDHDHDHDHLGHDNKGHKDG